jgi:radical SAM superfamily enzyme YgiQ (UPF0313 family)
VKVALISTYDMGRQPFGLASPAAWLGRRGHDVLCVDTSRERFPLEAVAGAELIAFHLPMHTATRLALPLIEKIRSVKTDAHICCYGLYAPMNEALLRSRGVKTILGGEFEQALSDVADGLDAPAISLAKLQFVLPDRSQLPALSSYARLQVDGQSKRAGYTEASRGCKHLCRHCPVVPVYNGAFRVVQRDVVLADIRQQVAAGAEHITFGDPDFFNGPGHAMGIVTALHAEFPRLTYDVTIKIEHLLKHRDRLACLRATGCLFVVSAVESLDDEVLLRLDKGHTRADFFEAAAAMRNAGLTLAPTFITFTPWTTWSGYRELLETLVEVDLVENVSPIQLAMRLLIPAGSRLLDLPEVRKMVGPFDPLALSYRWQHKDPALDQLCSDIQLLIQREERLKSSRSTMFAKIWELAHDRTLGVDFHLPARATIPYLNEPWYC